MGFYQAKFNIGKFSGFAEEIGRNIYFPDIMDYCCHSELVNLYISELHLPGYGNRQVGYFLLVARSIRVSQFHDFNHGIDCIVQGLPQRFVALFKFFVGFFALGDIGKETYHTFLAIYQSRGCFDISIDHSSIFS